MSCVVKSFVVAIAVLATLLTAEASAEPIEQVQVTFRSPQLRLPVGVDPSLSAPSSSMAAAEPPDCTMSVWGEFNGWRDASGYIWGQWYYAATNDCKLHPMDASVVEASLHWYDIKVSTAPRQQCYYSATNYCAFVGTQAFHDCTGCNGFWTMKSYHLLDLPAPYFWLPTDDPRCRYALGRVDVITCDLEAWTIL